MHLPVMIGGKTVGTLCLRREGRAWRACARLANQNRVLRLYIYGRGEPVYLGIPEPREGEMVLEKLLRSLPAEAAYCAEQPRGESAWPEREAARSAAQSAQEKPRRRVWMGGRPYYF